jgi:cation transport ATPase
LTSAKSLSAHETGTDPMIASAAMFFRSVSVISNALRLNRLEL